MFVINDTLGAYGGSHTLMYRMCVWLSEHKIKTVVLCSDASNAEIVKKIEATGARIQVVNRKHYQSLAYILKKLQQEEPIKVLNFIFDLFLDLEAIKKKYKLYFENFIYCIHPSTFKKGRGFQNSYLKQYSRKMIAKILMKMYKNSALVMMDEITLEETQNYLDKTFPSSPPIMRLPMICKNDLSADKIISKGFFSNTIITASRAEFPYKGYLLGLLDDFVYLNTKLSDIKLVIVSDGDDINILKNRINNLPSNIQQKISLFGWMEYELLLEKIKECKVFLGMGTSVLDAALCYKPSIAVRFDTYENIGDCLISERPELITPDQSCNDRAVLLLEKVLKMSDSEYKQEALDSFEKVKCTYDIDLFMKTLFNTQTISNESLLSKWEIFLHDANRFRLSMRTSSEKPFDYNNLIT